MVETETRTDRFLIRITLPRLIWLPLGLFFSISRRKETLLIDFCQCVRGLGVKLENIVQRGLDVLAQDRR